MRVFSRHGSGDGRGPAAQAPTPTAAGADGTGGSPARRLFPVIESLEGRTFLSITPTVVPMNVPAAAVVPGRAAPGSVAPAAATPARALAPTPAVASNPTANLTVPDALFNPNAITGLTLMNAATDTGINTLPNGAVLNYATLPTRLLSIRANVSDQVGSIIFDYDGVPGFKVENFAPYAIAGGNGTDYNPFTPTLGVHTLTVTPYSGPFGSGLVGTPVTVTFTVVNLPILTNFFLIDARSGRALANLNNGSSFDLAALPSRQLTIRADAIGPVGSVQFDYDTTAAIQVENGRPYALAGDRTGPIYNAFNFTTGAHTLTATPFTGSNASGSAGYPKTITFTVTDTNPPPVTPTPTPTTVPGLTILRLTLINTDTAQTIGVVTNGTVINLNQTPSRNLTIRAIVAGQTGRSVRFDWDGVVGFHTETSAPYTIAGDSAGPVYNPFAGLTPGTHTLTVQAFDGPFENGNIGPALTVTFNVV